LKRGVVFNKIEKPDKCRIHREKREKTTMPGKGRFLARGSLQNKARKRPKKSSGPQQLQTTTWKGSSRRDEACGQICKPFREEKTVEEKRYGTRKGAGRKKENDQEKAPFRLQFWGRIGGKSQ